MNGLGAAGAAETVVAAAIGAGAGVGRSITATGDETGADAVGLVAVSILAPDPQLLPVGAKGESGAAAGSDGVEGGAGRGGAACAGGEAGRGAGAAWARPEATADAPPLTAVPEVTPLSNSSSGSRRCA